MEQLLSDLTAFISDNQHLAGPIVALIAFGESLVFVGLLIPATATMLAIGGMLAAGLLEPLPVIGGAIVGAVLGDVVSYALGRWMGPGLTRRPILRRYRTAIARTRLFFRRYGFWAVFLGRFLGPIRSTVPLVAGMLEMNHLRFQLANVASAVIWAPLMLAPGWLGTQTIERMGLSSGTVSVLVLIAVLVATVWISAKMVRMAGAARDRKRVNP